MRSSQRLDPIVRIDRVHVTQGLMFAVAALTIVAVAMAVLDRSTSTGLIDEMVASIHRLFNPDLEANLSTWFSTALLLAAAMLIGLVATAKTVARDDLRGRWVAFAVLLLFLSIDEAAQIHEMIIKPTQQLLGVSGGDAWVWTIPAVFAVVLFAVASYRFFAAQPGQVRRLLIVAFGLYVFGAIGIEAFGGAVVGRGRPVAFEVAAAVEEFFEMTGVVVLIYTILGVLASLEANVGFQRRRTGPASEVSHDVTDHLAGPVA